MYYVNVLDLVRIYPQMDRIAKSKSYDADRSYIGYPARNAIPLGECASLPKPEAGLSREAAEAFVIMSSAHFDTMTEYQFV
jgi:hypothetical protein